jgi:site-specific DNA-methyltransferase (adenine-specific)
MKNLDFNEIYNMNCMEGIKQIPDDSVDLVITDPPFAIEFKAKRNNYNRKAARVLDGYNEISKFDS